MTTATLTGLTGFVLARLDEDEAVAAVAEDDRPGYRLGDFRVADVKAKRRIVAWVQAQHRASPHMSEWATLPLQYLAAAYSGHRDYRQEWSP